MSARLVLSNHRILSPFGRGRIDRRGTLRAPSLWLLAALGTGCAHGGAAPRTGMSDHFDQAGESEPSSEKPHTHGEPGGEPVADATAKPESAEPPVLTPPDKPKLPSREDVRRERELALADELLKVAPTPEGQLGLVLVLGQRAADLYWTFAVENRGSEPVSWDSDLSLLEITLTPKATDEGNAPAAPYVCSPLGKRVTTERGVLQPGDTEVFSFDPRSLCPEELLVEGTTVSAIYGYTIEKKIKWERGKRAEVLQTDQAPFVVAPARAESALTPQKQLFMPPLVLGETYPLDHLSLFAEADPRHRPVEAPDLPLAITIKDIGEARTPTFQVVNVTLKNTSETPLDVVVRRELMSFEVVGPKGATTCVLEPTQVDPLAHNFTRLPSGASRAVATRLPEVCPAGTFAEPGEYSVFVRYRSPSTGAEFGKEGFQGEVRATRPAHFRVPDPLKPSIRVAPIQRLKAPATTTEPTAGPTSSANPPAASDSPSVEPGPTP